MKVQFLILIGEFNMDVKNLGLFDPNVSEADKFVSLVRSDLNDIKHSFFTIGFRLHEANEFKYYKDLGYDNIIDCAEALFGFKKTTTYDLMEIYSECHDRKAKMCIAEEYDRYSQSQLKVITQISWARGDFIRYAQPEETVETFKKAKSLWNKLYNRGSSPHNRGKFSTLTEFLNLHSDMFPTLPAPDASDQAKDTTTKNSGYAENFIEVTAVDTEPEATDPDTLTEEISEQTEKLGEFAAKSLKYYLIHMGYKTIFDPDNKGLGVKVMPEEMSESTLYGLSRAIEKDRTKVKHMLTKYLVDRFGTFEYDITLYGRKQNFDVFCGTLAGALTDYLIKEFNGK